MKIIRSVNKVWFYTPKEFWIYFPLSSPTVSVQVARINKWPILNIYEDIASILLHLPCLFFPFGSILSEKVGKFSVIRF